jgi:hypothetical protein
MESREYGAEFYDQSMNQAWAANVKSDFERGLRNVDREREAQNDWHAFSLEQARTNGQIVNRLAQNGLTHDGVMFATVMAGQASQANIAAKVANDAAKAAMDQALAMTAQTSAGAQGTTGVAQGALQTQTPIELAQVLTNNNTVQLALLTSLAKLTSVVDALTLRVLGDVTIETAA